MFFSPQEWLRPAPESPAADLLVRAPCEGGYKPLYEALAHGVPDERARTAAADFLRAELQQARSEPCELPETCEDLAAWMQGGVQAVQAKYSLYLQERKAGAPRRFFKNRAHALYFLRSVAPTKLVDGAWLYGMLAQWPNPRFADLARTYLEELGEGAADKNHVVLYRSLLSRYGLDPLDDLPDPLYRQGLIQLALGCNAGEFLPEIVGFNLGYEQLPLHLLITAYELNELGLDPYYFTLHVTVDNADSGHARRACQAVWDATPKFGDGAAFWARVREGSKLAGAGTGTTEVIEGFDIQHEVLRFFERKALAGSAAHSDYCRIGGRTVNEWLSTPGGMAGFLAALEQAGWIRRGEPASNSRFWGLLQGERAQMFGVFSSYELQVIHDWLRGNAGADARAFDEPETTRRRPSFNALARSGAGACAPVHGQAAVDPDLELFKEQLQRANKQERARLLVAAMAPDRHWMPAGLHATQIFCAQQGLAPAG